MLPVVRRDSHGLLAANTIFLLRFFLDKLHFLLDWCGCYQNYFLSKRLHQSRRESKFIWLSILGDSTGVTIYVWTAFLYLKWIFVRLHVIARIVFENVSRRSLCGLNAILKAVVMSNGCKLIRTGKPASSFHHQPAPCRHYSPWLDCYMSTFDARSCRVTKIQLVCVSTQL